MNSLLLRQANFRWLWLGQTLLFCGVQFWFVAITWLMLERTGSGTSLALVLMAAALPRGLLMLPCGALSDHHPPRTLAIRAAWVLALCTALLTLLAQRGALDPGPVATLAALFGSAEALVYPSAMALLPRLVAPRLLGQAHAWLQGSEQISNVAGPALAGLALAFTGAGAALALDTALLLLAAGCFLQLRPRPVPWLQERAGGLLRGMRESLDFAWRHRAIRTGLGLIAMINLAVLGPVVIGVVELVTLRFGGGAATFGSLQAAYGVGALLGVALAGRCGGQPLRHPAAMLGWLSAALGLGLVGLAAAGHLWVVAAVLAAMGVAGGLVGVLATAWLQRETPGPLQGRVMALAMVAGVTFDPLSQALAGVLVDISLTALFLAGAGALLLTALLVLRPGGAAGSAPRRRCCADRLPPAPSAATGGKPGKHPPEDGRMNADAVVQAIQAVIAPTVMISACTLIQNTAPLASSWCRCSPSPWHGCSGRWFSPMGPWGSFSSARPPCCWASSRHPWKFASPTGRCAPRCAGRCP